MDYCKLTKLTIHKSTVIDLYDLLRHIKDVVDKYSSEPSYDPKRVYDEMVDVVYGDDGHYKRMMKILDITIKGKEVA